MPRGSRTPQTRKQHAEWREFQRSRKRGTDYRLTIEDMRALARSRGGRCLSPHYQPNPAKLEWECGKGHRWWSNPMNLRNAGSWCPRCSGNVVLIDDMVDLARRFGGKCLSTSYRGTTTKLRWCCKKGHVFSKQPAYIRQGHWCPECSPRRRVTLRQFQAIARKRGGQCLTPAGSTVRAEMKLRWRCNDRHEWSARAVDVRRGSWCPHCAGTARRTIEECRALARSRGGRCLSGAIVDTQTPLEWQCRHGHRWKASFGNVENYPTWCPHCAGVVKKTIENMHAFAAAKGGVCLSSRYRHMNSPLRWKCGEGHVWCAKPNSLQQGSWCRQCWNRRCGWYATKGRN